MAQMISKRHPCMTAEGEEMLAFDKRSDAIARVPRLKKRAERAGHSGYPNAAYRCSECGKYHLYDRNKNRAKREVKSAF